MNLLQWREVLLEALAVMYGLALLTVVAVLKLDGQDVPTQLLEGISTVTGAIVVLAGVKAVRK